MKVADIMEPAVRAVAVDTPVSEVVVSLADAQVTGLPVLDARNRVVGVVFEHRPDHRPGRDAKRRGTADPVGADAEAAMAGRMSRSGRAIGRSRDGAAVPARPDNIDRGGMT
jgi:CBS domain-containing protein